MIARLPPCLLFDLDGTIIDSLPGIEFSVRAAFDACQLSLHDPGIRHMVGPPIRTILARAGDVEDKASLDRLESAFRASYDGEGWRKTICFPQAIPILRTMRSRGHQLFVVSNKPRHISVKILDSEGVLGLFEAIFTADSRTPPFRSKDEILASLISQYRLSEHDCLFVGDTIEDAKAAAAAGIEFVFMTHGYGGACDDSSLPTHSKFDGFSEFLPLLIQEPVCD